MPEFCTYTTRPAPGSSSRCAAPATHACLGSGLGATWQAWDTLAPTVGSAGVQVWKAHRPEFCAAHAEAVAEARNQAFLAAKQAAALRPRTKQVPGCAVCGEPLQGVGRSLGESAGALCDACHAAAQSEQMDDPRTQPQPKRRRRKAA